MIKYICSAMDLYIVMSCPNKLEFLKGMNKYWDYFITRRHNERDGVSNYQRLGCLLRRRSRKTSKLRVTGLCEENSPMTAEFPSQRASNAENVSIWWRHQLECLFLWYDACICPAMKVLLLVTEFMGDG